MATDSDEPYWDDTTIIHINGKPVAWRQLVCPVGDYPRFKASIERCAARLVRRCGVLIVATTLCTLSGTAIDCTGTVLGGDDSLTVEWIDDDLNA